MLENSNRMWIFILLYILGLNSSQATEKDLGNSTQMYYAKLTIEENAIENITKILRPFVSNTDLYVDTLQKTTTCENVTDGRACTCEPSFKWSDEVCQSKPDCCSNRECIFKQSPSHMCVSDATVSITGNISLGGLEYYDCLAKKNSEKFRDCNNDLLEKMKEVFSTLKGFDHLTINKYSVGSVIAEFEMVIASGVEPQKLISKLEFLSTNLSSTAILETEGVVHLGMPDNPVQYNSIHNLKCTVRDNLNTTPTWQLKRGDSVFEITTGTESTVTLGTLETTIALKNITELWAGEYTCLYNQIKKGSYNIFHKASADLDVCLKPNIEITTVPGFPRCMTNISVLTVNVLCEIKNSSEKYNVTWERQNIDAEINEISVDSSGGITVYKAATFVPCDSSLTRPQVTCIFKNRCQQKTNASTKIDIIKDTDQYCEAEGDWGDAKAGSTAVLKCKNAAGRRTRKCKDGTPRGIWEPENSGCVNIEVDEVLQKAKIVDIGIGSLDGNTARVFHLLENVTNNTHNINSFANMDASVQVLVTLSQKPNLSPNQSTTDDFLDSSSNLLDKTLTASWLTKPGNNDTSLAARYLSSVEEIIQKANITGAPTKNNVDVASDNCSQSDCTNKVFNVTVSLHSRDLGNVRTAGFQELVNYLPNNDSDYTPNSIVVSTTAETQSDVEIKITFPLTKPRPRNVEIRCVYWDNTGWSSDGCEWIGPAQEREGQCKCTHLSSFAILMSRFPIDIKGINEITYVGLGVSIVSLIASLVIELIVWSSVVKTNTLHLRHTAHVNISLCLLVADICFLASSKPEDIELIWCKTFTVLKHFCYLSMFFWMLCLSTTLLHQAVFLFHSVSKKVYLRFSLILGYVCPLLIVISTFLASKSGAEGVYFSRETCWLVYTGLMEGTIHTFVIPVGIIVIVNVFSMVVVIMKLLDHPKNADSSLDKEKKAAVTVMRSVILLTPVFGVTWAFGFAVMLLDLTSGPLVFIVNYFFTLLNAFQGLFILLTTCLGDKLTREALLNRLRPKAQGSTTDSTTKLDSTLKK